MLADNHLADLAEMDHDRLAAVFKELQAVGHDVALAGFTEEEVARLINLDEATANVPLDFLVAFSSVAAVQGNVGQSDYATANAFMDRYAEYRNALVEAGRRHGHTLSINWPLWEHGGMRVDEATSIDTIRRRGAFWSVTK